MHRSAPRDTHESLAVPSVTAADVLLLRALLCPLPAAANAWHEWTGGLAEPAWIAALAPYKRIWPLILRAAAGNAWRVPRPVLSALKAAYVSEKIRHAHLWRLLERCVAELTLAGVSSVVQGGAVLAVTVYPEPGLRHTHALRLAVADVEGARHALVALGCRATQTIPSRDRAGLCLEGPNRETLVLHPDTALSPLVQRPGSSLALQPPPDALCSAFDETLAAGASPLLWAFDLFFATRTGVPAGTSNDQLLEEAQAVLADALRANGSTS